MRKRPMMLGSDCSTAMVPLKASDIRPAFKRPPHIAIYRSPNGWRWRLVGGNGEVIASGEGYSTKSNARRGARTMQRAAMEAELVDG